MTDKLLIGTYWWTPDKGSKFAAAYTADDVRRLARQVQRHCTVPYRFVVITDQPNAFLTTEDFDFGIHAIELDRSTHVPGTCFARLMTFHPEGPALFGGDRFLQIDLDTLIVGNIDHLVKRLENVVMWRNPARIPWDKPAMAGRPYYNTSLSLHKLGTMPEVWNTVADYVAKGERPPWKDDQWYLSDRFGPDMPYFDGARDGVYRIARPGEPETGVWGKVPENTCVITYPGSEGKPSNPVVRGANPWLAEYGV
jgi:hypothetical protein